VAVVGVLALGWLGDTLGQFAPRTTFHNGETQQAGLYRVALNIDPLPAHAGEQVAFQTRIEDGDERPASDVTARLVMTMPTMDMAPIEAFLVPTADGAYAAHATFPMSGSWLVRVEVTPPGAAPLRADFDVPVR
jgi:nitrogen fixation protein FixH